MYDNATSALYVYGGYELSSFGARLSSNLYVVQLVRSSANVSHVTWSRIETPDSGQVCAVMLGAVHTVFGNKCRTFLAPHSAQITSFMSNLHAHKPTHFIS